MSIEGLILNERVAIVKGWRLRSDGKWEEPPSRMICAQPSDYSTWDRQHGLINDLCKGLSNAEALRLGVQLTTIMRGKSMTRAEGVMTQWLEKFEPELAH